MTGRDPALRAGSWAVAPPGRGRIARRSAVRAAISGAGVATVGAVLAACSSGPAGGSGTGSRAGAAGTTKAAAATINLLWRPWYNFSGAQTKTGRALLMEGIQPWLEQNPGINVTITYLGYQGTTVSALLAGNGPDVFADWVIPDFDTGSTHLLLDLTNYVKQDNVDLSIFPSFEIQFYSQTGRLIALPSYFHLQAPAVNLGALDTLGLTYPQSGWTYQEWAKLYQDATVKGATSAKSMVGGQFIWSGYDGAGSNPHAYIMAGFGGEYINPRDRSQGYVGQPGSLAALQWCYELLAAGVCDTGGASFPLHKAVGSMDTAGGLVTAASALRNTKWQLFDEPVYPKAKTAYVWTDFYGISASTPHPDQAWSFMKYLTCEADWQNWMVKLALNGPNQKSLYQQWAATVRAVAPPLANIDLEVFTRQMQNNEPYFGTIVPYADTQTGSLINQSLVPAQKDIGSLPSAAQQADQRVDALQATQAQMAQAGAAASAKFPSNGPAIAGVVAGI